MYMYIYILHIYIGFTDRRSEPRGRRRTICSRRARSPPARERKFFVDSLLVRIHLIIRMSLVDRPCPPPSFLRPRPLSPAWRLLAVAWCVDRK